VASNAATDNYVSVVDLLMRDHNAASSLAMPFRAADLQMEEIADDGLDLPIEFAGLKEETAPSDKRSV
jgi:hypothetical protein